MAFITFKHSVSPPYAKELFSDTNLHGRRLNINFRTGSIHLPQQPAGAGRQGAPYQRSDSYNRRGGYHPANNSYSNRSDQRNGNAYASQHQQMQSVGMIRSEEHTSELQSPVPISYAVFCLKKKIKQKNHL